MPTATNINASPIPGYGIEELIWEVETSPGGPTVDIPGTVQDVYAELEKVNPNFVSDFGLEDPDNSTSVTAPLESRAYYIESIHCDWGGDYCSGQSILDGIKYLRGVPGQPKTGPGPGNCGRVSCSYNSAIYWCNDVSQKPFPLLATGRSMTNILPPAESLHLFTRLFQYHRRCCHEPLLGLWKWWNVVYVTD